MRRILVLSINVATVTLRRSVALLATVTMCACAPTPRYAIVMLLDFSGSHASGVSADVDLVADAIIPSLGAADELAILPIDDAAVQRPTRIVDIDMAHVSLAKLSDGVAHAETAEANRRRAFLDSTSGSARKAILEGANARRQFSQQTDIVGAIQNGARTWATSVGTPPNKWARIKSAVLGDPLYVTKVVLVIASDMLQEGRGIDFAHAAPGSTQARTSLIARLQAANAIPDLAGVDVIVSGATGASAKQVEDVRAFWLQYFAAAKARVVGYDFNARSAAVAYFGPARGLDDPRSER